MNSVNKTLYIPLYGKAYVSRKGLFLRDKKAEEIWAAEGFALKGKSRSKWLAYYMGIRAAVFDSWVRERLEEDKDATALHLGCGMDGRVLRVDGWSSWYDVDFPQVIEERGRYYAPMDGYKMVAADVRDGSWLENIPRTECAIVVMEGISMYLRPDELAKLLEEIGARFERVSLLMDCYTGLAAKLSKYKNPINDVGVTRVYGTDDPAALQRGGLRFVSEHSMTPEEYIDRLQGRERRIFRKIYAGGLAKKLYRLFEYRKI